MWNGLAVVRALREIPATIRVSLMRGEDPIVGAFRKIIAALRIALILGKYSVVRTLRVVPTAVRIAMRAFGGARGRIDRTQASPHEDEDDDDQKSRCTERDVQKCGYALTKSPHNDLLRA
jgi:hypothetical protein